MDLKICQKGRMLYWCSAATSGSEGYRGVSTTDGQLYNVILARLTVNPSLTIALLGQRTIPPYKSVPAIQGNPKKYNVVSKPTKAAIK